MNGSPRQITNFVADRLRAVMRVDHPQECAALQMGINEIEWLHRIAMRVFGCIQRPFKLPDGRVMELTTEAKARAYDVLSTFLSEEVVGSPLVAGPDRALEEMSVDDARCAETRLLVGSITPATIAMRDRRQLLEHVRMLEAQMAQLQERLTGAHCPGCEPPGCPGIPAECVNSVSAFARSPKEHE